MKKREKATKREATEQTGKSSGVRARVSGQVNRYNPAAPPQKKINYKKYHTTTIRTMKNKRKKEREKKRI